MIVYVDMDDVLCDFSGSAREFFKREPKAKFPQSRVGFFESLPAIEGAIEGVNYLRQQSVFDVYILTAPSTRNPCCYSEKRIWIENHFDYPFTKKLIISPNKGLLKGDVLVDDHISGKGQEAFEGKILQFGTEEFPNWESVIQELGTLAERHS